MIRSVFLLVISVLVAHATVAQDCSTLALSVTSKSNFNGFNTSCTGTSDGSFTVAASGGTGPYFFSMDGGFENTTGVFTGLPSGNYTTMVRDANNCEKQILVNLTMPTVLTGVAFVTSNYNGQDLSCAGSSDGTIMVVAIGGVSPYTYSLVELPGNITGQVSGIFTNLSAGTYSVKITDSNGCNVTTFAVTIDPPAPLLATSSITSSYNGYQVSCAGASDATITIAAFGGTAPYVYSFDQNPFNTSGMMSGVFTEIPAGGVYTFTVRDVNSCAAVTVPVIVSEPIPLAATGAVTSNYNGFGISCHNSSDGQLTTVATGGTGQYTYIIDQRPENVTGRSTGIFTGISSGVYTVTVRDVNNCLVSSPLVTLSQPSMLTANAIIDNGLPENCSDAQISVSATGGTASYTYHLEETINEDGVFSGLANGAYSILVRDLNGCVGLTPVQNVNQPTNLTMIVVPENTSCFGSQDGTITVTASGGSGYQFTLLESPENLTGLTTGIFTGLSAGDYTTRVRDQNQCEKTSSPTVISTPAEIITQISVSSNYNGAQISCAGAMDGKITVAAEGGIGGVFVYTLDGFPEQVNTSGAIFNGLGPGQYFVSVKDGSGCEASTTFVSLTEPQQITLQSIITSTPNNEGAVEVVVQGGTEPYNFLWSDGSTLQNLLNAASGEYSVQVKDANECSLSESFTIPLVVGLPEDDEELIHVLYDKQSGEAYLSCAINAPANVSIRLYSVRGAMLYATDKHQDTGTHQYILSSRLIPNLYIVKVGINQKVIIQKFVVF
jgi:hypothetical protein